MNPIVWLASYPKSGNTWFRVFLTNYLEDRSKPASINELLSTPIASGRKLFDDVLAVDAGDFAPDEYDSLRPEIYRGVARQASETPFMKVHDANIATPSGEPLLPVDATARAVYFVRDPRDVAVSLAHHSGAHTLQAVRAMNDPTNAFSSGSRRLEQQLRQRVLTWSGHVASWIDETQFPVHVLRYEDMVSYPTAAFAAAVRFLQLPFDDERLERALRFSSFEEMQRQERADGFLEAPRPDAPFFHRGRAGTWVEYLPADEAEMIEADHGEMMRRLGYLSEAEEVGDRISVSRVRT